MIKQFLTVLTAVSAQSFNDVPGLKEDKEKKRKKN